MRRLRKFLRLEKREQLLLLETVTLLAVVRLGLWLIPFRTVKKLLAKIEQGPARSRSSNPLSVNQIAWAVRVGSRAVPMATCLTQALTGQILLARRGHPAHLRIGVAKEPRKDLEAHAWLEYEGRVVIGDHGDLAHYTPLPSVE